MFIREHLSPRYLHIAKPLRELLTQLQEERKAGLKKGKAKFMPLGPAAPDNNWALFWQEEHENAFNLLKNMAACAVELQVPDMEGSRKGTNPFHVWLDACQYGIGGGPPWKSSQMDLLLTIRL